MNSKQAIAEYLNRDYYDMEDNRYQPKQGESPIYSIDNDYFCAVKSKSRLPKREGWIWEKIQTSRIYKQANRRMDDI